MREIFHRKINFTNTLNKSGHAVSSFKQVTKLSNKGLNIQTLYNRVQISFKHTKQTQVREKNTKNITNTKCQ